MKKVRFKYSDPSHKFWGAEFLNNTIYFVYCGLIHGAGKKSDSTMKIRSVRIIAILFIDFLFFLSSWLCIPNISFCDQSATLQSIDESEEIEKPFKRSELISSLSTMREGDLIDYKLIIRYDGAEDPMSATILFSIKSSPVMFVSSSPELVFHEDERNLEWSGVVSPGNDLIFTIKLVTLPDSSSNRSIQSSAGIFWRGSVSGKYWQGGSQWVDSKETEIHSKTSTGSKKVIKILLSYLIAGPIITLMIPWIIIRRDRKRQALDQKQVNRALPDYLFLYVISFFFFLMVGVAHFMGYIVYADFNRLYSFKETDCVLLDKKIVIDKVARTPGNIQGNDTKYIVPLVAVRYIADGHEVVVVGQPNPATIRSPIEKFAIRALSDYKLGQSYPCWYDPQDIKRFVLFRSISWGWYLIFAPFMLFLYILTRTIFRKIWRAEI